MTVKTTHSLIVDAEGSIVHFSHTHKLDERPRKVEVEWVRLHLGERVYAILQEEKKVNVTIH